MQINVNPKDIKIQYIPNPSDIEIQNLSMEYDFHEIILSDLFERNIQDKIDIYDDLMFIVCHFPKYNKGVGQYYSNEFKIILGNNFIIIISEIQSKRLSKLLQEFQKLEIESDEKYKSSPYYILYKFRDSMFDKSLKHISHFNKDLMEIEEDIYDSKLNKQVLSKIITKKRNISFVKNTMEQHEELLKELKKTTIHFYQGELDVYFEDLMSKLDKLENNILMTSKSVNSLMDSYNGLMNIQTNMTIKVLTIFTVFLGIASSISSIYGMNINLPFQEHELAFLIVMSIIVGLISSIYRIFKIYEII